MVAVLAGATAIALLVVALTLGGPVPSGEAAAATTQSALIRGFYDAVNNVLVGGDPDALDSFVAPNVVVHAPEGEISGRAALAEEIAALGGASPGLQL
ncbi:MAG TPA: nuclear transport factor 2 family protein, partial [Thermomicrobiales bacterium]|nr:nuclear transport factor 2 family protein [Thermomicrobiales bacterium]